MADFLDLIKQREEFSEKSQEELAKAVAALQSRLYANLSEQIISTLDVDADGKLLFNIANLRKLGKWGIIWATYKKQSSNFLVKWLVERLDKLLGLNTAYMEKVATVKKTIEESTRTKLFLSLGYDIDKGKLVEGGWLDNLTAQENVKQQVAQRLNAALANKMDATTFKKDFKDAMLDTKTGLGLVTKSMDFHAQNIFTSWDRAAQASYRDELKLNFAIYSGTIQNPTKKSKGTRPWCYKRVNNLYDLKTIEGWQNDSWSGKIEGTDVKVTAGGYQCRHHFSFVSNELAEKLQEKGKELNAYSPLPSHLQGKK